MTEETPQKLNDAWDPSLPVLDWRLGGFDGNRRATEKWRDEMRALAKKLGQAPYDETPPPPPPDHGLLIEY